MKHRLEQILRNWRPNHISFHFDPHCFWISLLIAWKYSGGFYSQRFIQCSFLDYGHLQSRIRPYPPSSSHILRVDYPVLVGLQTVFIANCPPYFCFEFPAVIICHIGKTGKNLIKFHYKPPNQTLFDKILFIVNGFLFVGRICRMWIRYLEDFTVFATRTLKVYTIQKMASWTKERRNNSLKS